MGAPGAETIDMEGGGNMAVKENVLAALLSAQGAPVSGQRLADVLGVSRAAVWKAVKELQKQGHAVHSEAGRGYVLAGAGGEVLCREGVQAFRRSAGETHVLPCVDSPNLYAKQLAAGGAGHGTLVAAGMQTAGRGRRGRSFASPEGAGLYLSVILKTGLPMQDAALTTCAAAVAVRRAVKAVCGKELAIKWVNALYWQGKKCCGIHTEAVTDVDSGGLDHMVGGIGIDLVRPQGGWGEGLEDIVGALYAPGQPVPRCALAAAVTDELLALSAVLPRAPFMPEYIAHNFVPGHDVTLLRGGAAVPAYAVRITQAGHLVVRTEEGEHEVSFGEVSLRMKKEEEEPV